MKHILPNMSFVFHTRKSGLEQPEWKQTTELNFVCVCVN